MAGSTTTPPVCMMTCQSYSQQQAILLALLLVATCFTYNWIVLTICATSPLDISILKFLTNHRFYIHLKTLRASFMVAAAAGQTTASVDDD